MRGQPLTHRLPRRLALLGFTLLVLFLPALAAGAAMDREPGAEELARIRAVLARTPAEGALPGSLPGKHFFPLTLWALAPDEALQALERGGPGRQEVVTRARFVGVLTHFLLAAFVYLALAPGRGRLVGLLAAGTLAALPPIALEGYVLRPEVPAAAASMLAVALLLAAMAVERPLRSLPELTRWSVRLAHFCAAGLLCGLAAAFHPRAGILALLPTALLSLQTLGLIVAFPRVFRRHPATLIPIRAIGQRTLPWIAAMLLWLWLCAIVIMIGYEPGTGALAPSASAVGVLPQNWLLRAPLLALAAFGVLRWVGAAGRRLTRGQRVGSEAVLLIFGALLVGQHARAGHGDAMLAAVPVAIAVAEGIAFCLRAVLRGHLRRQGTMIAA